jgi:cellulose synthase/poly-beta-1,6-N-acetylglucosamine synthase-like glycosyltransferase
MLTALFWFSVAFVFYAYCGYPLLLLALSLFMGRPVAKGDMTPRVSFIITAYNEEKRIREKVENTLGQSYPPDRLEIIVASDGSTDQTDEIVKRYSARGVKLIRASERKGKENAQKLAVEAASGEILVFSDVSTVLDPGGVMSIVRNFNDPCIGCVSSVDRVIGRDGRVGGEGSYVRYEMFLRRLESRVNTLVGLSGSFFAARREACFPWSPDLASDFNTLFNSVRIGLRGILDPESVGSYRDLEDEKKEYHRKVRTVLRGIRVFMNHVYLLNPFRYGFFSWQLLSHKLFRWMVPFAMILAFVSNMFLARESIYYLVAFLAQVVFYVGAVLGIWLNRLFVGSILKIFTYFVLVNLSILSAWYSYVRGERIVKWEPSAR